MQPCTLDKAQKICITAIVYGHDTIWKTLNRCEKYEIATMVKGEKVLICKIAKPKRAAPNVKTH